MVRASPQEQAGGAGTSEVTAALQRIGWGPVVPNVQHDLGTDLFAQARDARRFDRGLFVGVQVKVGPSYFAQPAHTEDGSLRCQPPRSFWIRAKQYTPGPITCGVCGQKFQPQDAGPQ